MIKDRKVLLLVGSPKATGSTSASLGAYFLNRLKENGLTTEGINIYPALRSDEGQREILTAIHKSDIIVLSFPLYADCLPAGVIKLLETITERHRKSTLHPAAFKALEQIVDLVEITDLSSAAVLIERLLAAVPVIPSVLKWGFMLMLNQALRHRKVSPQTLQPIKTYLHSQEHRDQSLVVIVNSGFPEASQSDVAVAICRQFAEETGLQWLGALQLGAGTAIDSKPLQKSGGMVRNVMKALDIAAVDIANGEPISKESIELMSRPMMPKWMYILFGGLGWRLQSWKNRVWWKLHARPYER